jgi:hypothetical protein
MNTWDRMSDSELASAIVEACAVPRTAVSASSPRYLRTTLDVRVVGDPGEMPAQLDDSGELATFVEGPADSATEASTQNMLRA